jgi:hypothetical protein
MATQSTVVEATLYWANLIRKNEMSGKYQVDIGNLDKVAVKKLEGLGLTIKTDANKDDDDKPRKGRFVTAKSNYPIKVMFKPGIESVEADTIGNGTLAKVKVHAYDWKFKTKVGTSAGVTKLQVTDLKVYEGLVDDDDDDDDDWGDDDGDDALEDFKDA